MTAALAPLLLVPSLENKTTFICLSPFGITIGTCFRDQQTWPSIALSLSAHAPTTAHQECLRRLMQALNSQRPSSRLGSAISSQQDAMAQRRSPSPPRRPVRNPSRPRTLLIASPAELRPLETTVEVVAPSIPPSPLFFEPSSREPPARLESPYRPAAGANARFRQIKLKLDFRGDIRNILAAPVAGVLRHREVVGRWCIFHSPGQLALLSLCDILHPMKQELADWTVVAQTFTRQSTRRRLRRPTASTTTARAASTPRPSRPRPPILLSVKTIPRTILPPLPLSALAVQSIGRSTSQDRKSVV